MSGYCRQGWTGNATVCKHEIRSVRWEARGAGRGGRSVIVKKYEQVVICRTLTTVYIFFPFFA